VGAEKVSRRPKRGGEVGGRAIGGNGPLVKERSTIFHGQEKSDPQVILKGIRFTGHQNGGANWAGKNQRKGGFPNASIEQLCGWEKREIKIRKKAQIVNS